MTHLHHQLLLHLAKGLLAHCRLLIQYSNTVDQLADILSQLEQEMDCGVLDHKKLTDLMEQAQEIKLAACEETLYMLANAVGHLAFSLREGELRRAKSALTIVMAEIALHLRLGAGL